MLNLSFFVVLNYLLICLQKCLTCSKLYGIVCVTEKSEVIIMARRRPSGDGMVRLRKPDEWEGRIVVGHKENGAPIFRYTYHHTISKVKLRFITLLLQAGILISTF